MSYQVAAPREKAFVTPQMAVAWFLRDMADVSGYMGSGAAVRSPLAAYALFRPVLTLPDPWYFAGVVALEAAKITDLFETPQADEVLREVFGTMDKVIGRDDNDASSLAILIMGRLGMGSLILHRRVPDNLLAKVMMILLGSAEAAAPLMPDDTAHEKIRKALKLGKPVWWTMFDRRYELTDAADDEAVSAA
jgi:hypothetical protein